MAVEARHLYLFPPQILPNREMVNGTTVEGGGGGGGGIFMGSNPIYDGGMGYGMVSGTPTTTTADTFIPPPPMYGTTFTPMKSDSGLTSSIPVVLSRKRPRDCAAPTGITNYGQFLSVPANNNGSNRCTFLGEDISYQIHQPQFEVDQLIAQHAAKVRRVIEEQRKGYWRRIIRTLEENITQKLRAKDEEIENIGKLNWALEDKVKSLSVENEIWRELAQNNEATANALRTNLQQVLAQAQNPPASEGLILTDNDEDDAESCCGSNLVIEEKEAEKSAAEDNAGCGGGRVMKNCGVCRNCGKEEASVLVLPCRHLCLCYVCGPVLHSCPICFSTKNATLHINLSPSSSS